MYSYFSDLEQEIQEMPRSQRCSKDDDLSILMQSVDKLIWAVDQIVAMNEAQKVSQAHEPIYVPQQNWLRPRSHRLQLNPPLIPRPNLGFKRENSITRREEDDRDSFFRITTLERDNQPTKKCEIC